MSTFTRAKKTGSNPFDRNGDGRINLDDLWIAIRQGVQWVISWRGVMVVNLAFTLFSAYLNVISWIAVFGPMGGMAPIAGVLTWGYIQMEELAPILDHLNLDSAIAALVRITRAPHEIPKFNAAVTPEAETAIDDFQNRGMKSDRFDKAKRWFFYGLEFAVLVVGGAVLSPVGIVWGAVLLAFVGMIGVENGLRGFSKSGEKLLSAEERELAQTIRDSANRDTVRL